MKNARFGFCCKLSEHSLKKGLVAMPDYNFKTTTMKWLRENKDTAETRVWQLIEHNTAALLRLIEHVGALPYNQRMVRIGSDVLPGYTEPNWAAWWQKPDVQQYVERAFAKAGARARELDVRLSFHPGQFVVLASDNPDVVRRSIDEFEYHASMARWMGYGQHFQDFKINVHISGRAGPEGMRAAYQRLSPEARNCITVENEEYSWGVDACLQLVDIMPTVLDVHHHFIKTGEHIDTNSDTVKRVIDSWQGVRPVLHYSVSSELLLAGHATDQLPNLAQLQQQGFTKQALRAHSSYYWNTAVNEWVLQFADRFDIQCESKAKNLARDQLLGLG